MRILEPVQDSELITILILIPILVLLAFLLAENPTIIDYYSTEYLSEFF